MWLEQVAAVLSATAVRRVAADAAMIRAAVLVPLWAEAGELWVLLTRRSDSLARHAGQISFPGGVCDPADGDEVATALRETREELGIDENLVLVVGQLDDQVTSTGYVITPVVGALPRGLEIQPASDEVDQVIRVPFRVLANPRLVERQEVLVEGRPVAIPIFHYHGQRIWGATARMVADLVERLSGQELPGVEAPDP